MAKTKTTLRRHPAPKAPVLLVESEGEMASRATPEEGEIVEEGKIVEEGEEGQAEEQPSQEGDDEEERQEEAEGEPAQKKKKEKITKISQEQCKQY